MCVLQSFMYLSMLDMFRVSKIKAAISLQGSMCCCYGLVEHEILPAFIKLWACTLPFSTTMLKIKRRHWEISLHYAQRELFIQL
jgi:hypothetical protein